jgi:hypothetical protein
MFSKGLKMLVNKGFKNDWKLTYEPGFQDMTDVDIISAVVEERYDGGENGEGESEEDGNSEPVSHSMALQCADTLIGWK